MRQQCVLLLKFWESEGGWDFFLTALFILQPLYYLTYDQVGSLRIVVDMSSNVVKRIDYDSFGNVVSDTNPEFRVPFGFAGGLYDPDTGLIRFGYRDYDPDTGRWTAKDPIFFPGRDTNLYGYVLNNPVNLVDPYGLAWSDILPAIGTAISQGLQGGAYAVGQAAQDTADIAINGHPLAQAALWLAALSEVAPLTGAAASSDTVVGAVYQWLHIVMLLLIMFHLLCQRHRHLQIGRAC